MVPNDATIGFFLLVFYNPVKITYVFNYTK